jgi:hypothetical protein
MLAFPVRNSRKNQPAPLQKNYCYRCVNQAKADTEDCDRNGDGKSG